MPTDYTSTSAGRGPKDWTGPATGKVKRRKGGGGMSVLGGIGNALSSIEGMATGLPGFYRSAYSSITREDRKSVV